MSGLSMSPRACASDSVVRCSQARNAVTSDGESRSRWSWTFTSRNHSASVCVLPERGLGEQPFELRPAEVDERKPVDVGECAVGRDEGVGAVSQRRRGENGIERVEPLVLLEQCQPVRKLLSPRAQERSERDDVPFGLLHRYRAVATAGEDVDELLQDVD